MEVDLCSLMGTEIPTIWLVMDCGLLGMLLCWRREPGCSCIFFLSHFLWRLLCMCDKIGSKTGIARVCSLLSHVLLLHDVWQRAEGGWKRRSWSSLTFVIQWLSWPGNHMWYWERILYLPWRETRIQMRMCEIENLMCAAVWAVLLGAFVERGYCGFSSGFSNLVCFWCFLCKHCSFSLCFETSVHAHIVTVKDWRSTSYHWLLQMCNIESDAASLLCLIQFFVGMSTRESSNILSKPPWYLQTIVQTGIGCLPTTSTSLVMCHKEKLICFDVSKNSSTVTSLTSLLDLTQCFPNPEKTYFHELEHCLRDSKWNQMLYNGIIDTTKLIWQYKSHEH